MATYATTLNDDGGCTVHQNLTSVNVSNMFYSDRFSGGFRAYGSPSVPVEFNFDGSFWSAFDVVDEAAIDVHADCTFTRNSSRPTILTSGDVIMTSVREATVPVMTNIVKTVQGVGHKNEVQSIVVNSTDGLFLGGF